MGAGRLLAGTAEGCRPDPPGVGRNEVGRKDNLGKSVVLVVVVALAVVALAVLVEVPLLPVAVFEALPLSALRPRRAASASL